MRDCFGEWFRLFVKMLAVAAAMFLTGMALFALCLLGSCSRRIHAVALESSAFVEHVDSARVVRQTADSVVIRDSVLIYRSGDTILAREVRTRDRWRTRVDTVCGVRVDTVHIREPTMPAEIAVVSGKKHGAAGASVLVLVLVAVALVSLYSKLRK